MAHRKGLFRPASSLELVPAESWFISIATDALLDLHDLFTGE
jgi:hypothetical protein